MTLNDEGIVVSRPKSAPETKAKVPPELTIALAKSRMAKTAFDAFPPGHRRENVEWIAEAKREETKAKRVAQVVQWIAKGKSRNWKYAST